MKHLLLFVGLLLAVAGCRTSGPSFNAYEDPSKAFASIPLTNRIDPSLLKAPTEPYRLGPGDTIEIEAVGEASGHAAVTLGPDGKIYYSLLPGISLWGLSIPECRSLLQKETAKYNRAPPDLVINLKGVASQRVWFLGAISPGLYPLASPTTLLEAVATLGGVPTAGTDDAIDFSRSFVLRNGKFLPVDFERLLKHTDLTQNIYLMPDDLVFIRPIDLPSVYVLGGVNGPTILPYSRDLTLARAIINTGGPQRFALQNRVVILRGSLTQPRLADVNYHAIVSGKAPDLRLEPGDIIYIPLNPFRKLAQLAEDMVDQVVRTIAVNEGVYIGSGKEQAAGVNFNLSGGAGINTGVGLGVPTR